MSYFQLIAGGDELRAVPKTCSRLNSHAINRCCNDKGNPTNQVVYGFVLFHSDEIRYGFILISAYMGAKIMISVLNK